MRVERFAGAVVPAKMWTDGVPVEPQALEQIKATASLPFIHRHIAVMPDVHLGIGATIGTVIPTKGALVPAAVGVDIGCGMIARQTSLTSHDLPDHLRDVRNAIEAAVPVGNGPGGQFKADDPGAASWRRALKPELDRLLDLDPHLARAVDAGQPGRQLGTLGGGNHFIELCLDEADHVWVVLHSGSRGIGNKIGSFYIQLARKEAERSHLSLPHRDLAYLPEGTEHFDRYVRAMLWAQDYARRNREAMRDRVLAALNEALARPVAFLAAGAVNCHHNYCEREHHFGQDVWVTRKGAVRAREGDLGLIPGSMGARSYIVRGRGNPESFHSCSHGAGRAMSRTEAKRRFTVEDHEQATRGVECRKDAGVVDETPGAYKDIDAVMAAQADLVEIVHTLRQVVCVKG